MGMQAYPPERHLLRDLRLASERLPDGRRMALLPVVPEVLDDTGAVRVGAIATLMDVAGASVALESVLPDRTATVELAYQTAQPGREGPLLAVASTLRAGSKQVVIDVEVLDGCGADDPATALPIGVGTMTFSRLAQRPDHAPIRAVDVARAAQGRNTLASATSRLERPLLEASGLRVLDAARGALELDNHDWVRNSFGTLNGGMVAILIERAGELAARAASGARLGVCDLAVHYLGQTRAGPARTSTRVLRAAAGHAVVRVELRDRSNADQLVALGSVTAALR